MDLSKLSDEDLIALSQGNLQALSDEGLGILAGKQPTQPAENKEESTGFLKSVAGGFVRAGNVGMNALDMASAGLATLAGDTEGANKIFAGMEQRGQDLETMLPKPATSTMSKIGEALGGLPQYLNPVTGGLQAVGAGVGSAKGVIAQGGDVSTALQAGATSTGLQTALQAVPPLVTAGKTAATLSGAGMGAATTAIDPMAQNAIRRSANLPEVEMPTSEDYVAQTVLGGVFGRMAGSAYNKQQQAKPQPKPTPTDFRAAAIEAVKATEPQQAKPLDAQVQLDLDLGQPNQYGQHPSKFVVDENGIPHDPSMTLEVQTAGRFNKDLFSDENVVNELYQDWKDGLEPSVDGFPKEDRGYLKAQEVEQAYVQKAKQDAQVLEEALNQPQQASVQRPRSLLGRGMGKRQQGALDPSVFLEGFDTMNKALSKATDTLAPILNKVLPDSWRNQDNTVKILIHNTTGKDFDPRVIDAQGDLGIHLGTSATSPAVRTRPKLADIKPNTEVNFFENLSKQAKSESEFGALEKGKRPIPYEQERSLPYVLNSNKVIKLDVDSGNWETPTKVASLLQERDIITPQERSQIEAHTTQQGEESAIKVLRELLVSKGIDAIEYTNTFERIEGSEAPPTSVVVLNKDKLVPLSDAVASGTKKPNYSAMAKGQSGAVRPGEIIDGLEILYNKIKPNNVDEYKTAAKQAGLNTSDTVVQQMFDGLQKEQQVNKNLTRNIKAESIFNKITKGAAKNAVDVVKLDPDTVLKGLVEGPDSESRTNFFEKHAMSQGYMPAEASKNAPYQAAVRYLKTVIDTNKTRAEQVLFGDGVRRGTNIGLITALNRLEGLINPKDAADLTKQWFKAKDNPNYQFNFTADQQKVHQIKEQVFTEILQNVNSKLPEGKQIEALPNYIPSVYQGKFWGQATMMKADGTFTKPIIFAADNNFKAQSIKKRLAEQGYTVSDVKTRGNTQTDFGMVGSSKAADFQYMLDVMSDTSPEVKELYSAISREMQGRATTTKGQHQHQKEYRGFEGELGNRPWQSDRQNYYDAKRMLTDFVEAHYDWMSAQEGAEFGKKVMDPANKVKENNRENVLNYINDNVIGKRFTSGIDNVVNDLVESITGASPKQAKQVSNTVGTLYTQMLTACASPIHMLQNIVQPITVLIPQLTKEGGMFKPVDALEAMSKGAVEYAYVFAGKQAGELGKLFGADAVKILGSDNFNSKMAYAEQTGLINPTLVESGALFDTKLANRVYDFTTQGVLSKPSEQAARWTVFSTMADWYIKQGKSKQEAYTRAGEVAETYMVDYGSDAKAGVWKSLGTMGNILGRLQTFSTNQFSQLYVYGKNAPRSLNDAAAFTSLLGTYYMVAGMAGMPGFDLLEEGVNRLMSKDGKTFSLRNYLRQNVGDTAYGGAWELTGLGAAPSFATKAINTGADGVPMPTMLGMPIAGKMAEQGATVGRRLFGNTPWGAETEAEKGKELLQFAPTSARNLIEDKYLKQTLPSGVKRISPNTGKPVHTEQKGEFSLGNIRSKERAKSSELAQEKYKETNTFNKQKKELESELTKLGYDMFSYGNTSPMKVNRFSTMMAKYINNYTGDPQEINKIISDVSQGVSQFDNDDLAQIVRITQKGNLTSDDVRKLLLNKKYLELRKQ